MAIGRTSLAAGELQNLIGRHPDTSASAELAHDAATTTHDAQLSDNDAAVTVLDEFDFTPRHEPSAFSHVLRDRH